LSIIPKSLVYGLYINLGIKAKSFTSKHFSRRALPVELFDTIELYEKFIKPMDRNTED
jgi:hypothetical protein